MARCDFNNSKQTGEEREWEGARAHAEGSACVSTCVGEPYAAKWQPTGGERLMKTV